MMARFFNIVNPLNLYRNIFDISQNNLRLLMTLLISSRVDATKYLSYNLNDDKNLSYTLLLNQSPETEQCNQSFLVPSILNKVLEYLPNCNASLLNVVNNLQDLVQAYFKYKVVVPPSSSNDTEGFFHQCKFTEKEEYYAIVFKNKDELINSNFIECLNNIINEAFHQVASENRYDSTDFWKYVGITVGSTIGIIALCYMICIAYAIITDRKEKKLSEKQTSDYQEIEMEVITQKDDVKDEINSIGLNKIPYPLLFNNQNSSSQSPISKEEILCPLLHETSNVMKNSL